MSLNEDFDKGTQGAKRASWKKLHFRDLALKVCEDNPRSSLDELAQLFLAELEKFPDYMDSIAVYIMANIKAALASRHPSFTRKVEGTVIKNIVAKTTAQLLMQLQMPNGKTLAESTGRECRRAGGWLTKVGETVGDRGIVGEKLTEADLRKLFRK